MTPLCAPAHQFTLISALPDAGMPRSPSKRVAAEAAQRSIHASYVAPYPSFEDDCSDDQMIKPATGGEVIDLTSESESESDDDDDDDDDEGDGEGEVSALFEVRAIRETDVV